MFDIEVLEEMHMAQKPSRRERLLKDSKLNRKNWNGINPVTKVDKNRKAYDRKQFKRISLNVED